MINATPKALRRAANIKERIDALQSELIAILGDGAPAASSAKAGTNGRKRKMSAAGRTAIAAAARARWARYRSAASPAKPAKKGKSKMSAAGRRALSKAAKARWAKAKAQGKTRL